MPKHCSYLYPLSLALAVAPATFAQDPEEIIVVGVVPAGATMELEKYPYPVQSAGSDDLDTMDVVSLSDFLKHSFTSVSVNDAQNNPLQADLQYRGFTASPLLGLAQGLSVYQNGARINAWAGA